jgi:[CysO sulfur-carrier protein]-S-L-cysteine hydrolase
MEIAQPQLEELIAHAREEVPNECCGYMTIRDGAVQDVVRAQNERNSPYGYQLESRAQITAWNLGENEGYDIAVYHSHPKSPAEPSQTDINLAVFPEWLQVIISLKDEPHVRAWRIADGRVEEEPVSVG